MFLMEFWNIKVNESRYMKCGVTTNFFTGQNLLKKYWENINTGKINWEKLFDRSADQK